MIYGVGLFICLFAVCVSSPFGEVSVKISCQFLNWVFSYCGVVVGFLGAGVERYSA